MGDGVGRIFSPGRPSEMGSGDTAKMAVSTRMGGLVIVGRRDSMLCLADDAADKEMATTPADLPISVSVVSKGPIQAVLTIVRQDNFAQVSGGFPVGSSPPKRVTVAPPPPVMGFAPCTLCYVLVAVWNRA